MTTASEQILSHNVAHQIALSRYSTGVTKKILAILARTDKKIVKRLERDGLTEIGRMRLQRQLKAIREILKDGHEQLAGALRSELLGLTQQEISFQGELFTQAIPVQLDYATPSPHQVYAAAMARPFQTKMMREWLADYERAKRQKIIGTIQQGFITGDTTNQIVQNLRGTRSMSYRNGVLRSTRSSAERMVRTSIAHFASVARDRFYEENQDIIKAEKYVAVLDSRTSNICKSLDGKVFERGKGVMTPAHPNCRSLRTPILKSFAELGFDVRELPPSVRSSMNGTVPADMNYEEWLRKQSVSVQNDALGATRAKLFRKGGMTIDKFVDKRGASYTLDQLRKRDAAAFEMAGV
ncbi:minor capsid protein [Cognatishimia sp.]|uniref:minor capsid protein n=1 Tax=Cognatishimia sp. TaxID=2211648 RepID=UPI003516E39B|nr:minor capsid protein [Cognatishimia sp.]